MNSNFIIPESIREKADIENIARVICVHKERYTIKTAEGTKSAEITGNMRYGAQDRTDFPAVGDWVEFMPFDEDMAIINAVLPRFSTLQRKAVGEEAQAQLIASNIDFCFVVMAFNQDFNIKRLERYISIIYDGKIQPIIVLSKTDLQEDFLRLAQQVEQRFPDIPIVCTSTADEGSFEQIESQLEAGKTYCFVGSSGVGKSTIINHLLGEEVLATKTLSNSNQKGRHTTTHRELFHLPNGAMLIDTPGMRELGMVDNARGLEMTFSAMSDLAKACKYSDCTHTNEPGCAILEALEDGSLSESEYDNYIKLYKEQAHYAETLQDKKQKGKELARKIKEVKASKQRYK